MDSCLDMDSCSNITRKCSRLTVTGSGVCTAKSFVPFLVGTKFDMFSAHVAERQESTVAHARKFAKAMKAPLIFTSASHSINVQKLFKIVLALRFNLKVNVPKLTQVGEPLIEY